MRQWHGPIRLSEIGCDVAAIGFDRQRAGQQQGDRSRQQAVLDRADPIVEGLRVVVREDRNGLLGDDRTTVQRGVDKVDGTAGQADPMDKGVGDGMRAWKGGQQ